MQEIYEMQAHPSVRKIPWRSKRQPTPVWAIVQRIAKSGTQLKDWTCLSLQCLKSKYWYWGFFSFLVLILTSFCRSYCYGFFVVCFFEEWTVCVCTESLQLCLTLVTPWTIACWAPLSMGLLRQEYWNGLSCPPLGDLPNPGTELTSLMSPALAGGLFTTSTTWEAQGMG